MIAGRDAWHRGELIEIGETLVNDAVAPGDKTAAEVQSDPEGRMRTLAENDRSARKAMSPDDAVAATMRLPTKPPDGRGWPGCPPACRAWTNA